MPYRYRVLGLLFLLYALFLPRLEPTDRPPHRPYYNAALYWYFVTLVYLAVFLILYIVPNVSG